MSKAQETLDAELISLAALVNHDAAMILADTKVYGQPMCNYTHSARELEQLLVQRGLFSASPAAPQDGK